MASSAQHCQRAFAIQRDVGVSDFVTLAARNHQAASPASLSPPDFPESGRPVRTGFGRDCEFAGAQNRGTLYSSHGGSMKIRVDNVPGVAVLPVASRNALGFPRKSSQGARSVAPSFGTWAVRTAPALSASTPGPADELTLAWRPWQTSLRDLSGWNSRLSRLLRRGVVTFSSSTRGRMRTRLSSARNAAGRHGEGRDRRDSICRCREWATSSVRAPGENEAEAIKRQLSLGDDAVCVIRRLCEAESP